MKYSFVNPTAADPRPAPIVFFETQLVEDGEHISLQAQVYAYRHCKYSGPDWPMRFEVLDESGEAVYYGLCDEHDTFGGRGETRNEAYELLI